MVNLAKKLAVHWRTGILGAGVSVVVGLLLSYTLLGQGLVHGSYDFLFLFRPLAAIQDCLIIFMDQSAYDKYHQEYGQIWDRKLHAQLLDRLTAARAKVVVFDITFLEQGDPASNQRFAEAIRKNGKVVLAASWEQIHSPGLVNWALVPKVEEPPWNLLYTNAAAWGLTQLHPEDRKNLFARRHYPGTSDYESLPWAAAKVARAPIAGDPSQRLNHSRWLNHYGPAGTIPSISYSLASDPSQGEDLFRDKYVFIGGKPATRFSREEEDEFFTPYTHWDGNAASGVEIMATTLLNLAHDDWLTRLPAWGEVLLLLGSGLWTGFGLAWVRPWKGAVLALFAGVLISVLVLVLAWRSFLWFAWLVLLVQIASGWICSLISYKQAPQPEPAPRGSEATTRLAASQEITRQVPVIPDHALKRFISRGAFGEVWLAQNAIGMFRAVKIVNRRNFADETPYEREYDGIKRFMPISLSHPGLLNIFHVGRHDAEGFFFYIMEAGDDETLGQQIHPETYHPKTLDTELKKRGHLSVAECLSLMLSLTQTVEHLHQQKLIHRDIKPSNVIYVNGRPKLADIGLVTEFKTTAALAGGTIIGTPGYMPDQLWKGWGTPAVDIYSLGRVLYVCLSGKSPTDFPELPTDLTQRPHARFLMDLNNIVCKACEEEISRRYTAVAEMETNLQQLQNRLPAQP